MRLFIAIEMPDEAKNVAGALQKEICWASHTKSENLHVTLKFLGEVEDGDVKGISDCLAKVRFSPFRIHLEKIGVFPDEQSPRVVWLSCEPREPQIALKTEIDRALPGFKDDHPFQSHITLARLKNPSAEERRSLSEAMSNPKLKKIEFEVNSFALFRSTLTPAGSKYEKIRECCAQPL
jgi:RNA 2',3'-cyclic 3'-phosphodiesterase